MTVPRTTLAVGLVMLLGVSCTHADGVSPSRVQAVRTITDFMNSGDTTGLRRAFADSLLEDLSLDDIVATRHSLMEKYGPLDSTSDPVFDSLGHALVWAAYKQAVLDVTFTLDGDDKVTQISVCLSPTWNTSVDGTGSSTGTNPTLLDSPDKLIRRFDADTGFVRLVALLSPT